MIGIPFVSLDDASRAHLTGGGRAVILFTGNIGDAAAVTALTTEMACAVEAPVLVAVDQEFSPQVRRLGPDLITPLPTAEEALAMPPADLEGAGRRLGNELLNLGINMNLAPVIDVVRGENPVLVSRHLGADPEEVAEKSVAFITGLEDAGVIAVPKHFPGHGLSRTDPHEVTPVIDASLEELTAVDFIPFRAAFDAGVRAVMVGHPVYTDIDPDRPASLSPIILSVLRDAFGFDGVAVTDSLSIAAVTTDHSSAELVVAALVAGEDLLLFQDHTRLDEGVEGIIDAVESGGLDEARLMEAAEKVRALADSMPDQCG